MNHLFLAPFVIWRRLPQLWFEALHPNPLVSQESQRAVTEKLAALGEGIVAAQIEAVKASIDIAVAAVTGGAPLAKASRVPRRIAHAALAPAGRRVRANARRLK